VFPENVSLTCRLKNKDMNILITNGACRPDFGFDEKADIAIAEGTIFPSRTIRERLSIRIAPSTHKLHRSCRASGLAARLREPGYEHEGMLATEMAARSQACDQSGCPPDTDPVLDESGPGRNAQVPRREVAASRLFRWVRSRRGLAAKCSPKWPNSPKPLRRFRAGPTCR